MVKRGHGSEISISDDNHHITEAIGDMYGDKNGGGRRDPRPLSWVKSPSAEAFDQDTTLRYDNPSSPSTTTGRPPLVPTESNDRLPRQSNGSPISAKLPINGLENDAASLSGSSRPTSQIATQQFPLNDIDYESSPAAVAQELSNLQAIRRMSMDVSAADPDLPAFSSNSGVPSIAPNHNADPDDTSRLFWVPARVHPELAPTEFKSFIEDKVSRIKRRSIGEDSLSAESTQSLSSSGSGLRRKKSMLSRQVEEPTGYKDGAERLERKRSSGQPIYSPTIANIQELETIVKDPKILMRRLSVDSSRRTSESGADMSDPEDMPILPPAPSGQTLKRSTRTKYRRGSLRKGERTPTSRKTFDKQSENETGSLKSASQHDLNEEPIRPLARVQTEPISSSYQESSGPAPSEWERPKDPMYNEQNARQNGDSKPQPLPPSRYTPDEIPPRLPVKTFHSKIASNGRTTASFPALNEPPIQKVNSHVSKSLEASNQSSSQYEPSRPNIFQNQQIPERKSSHEPPNKFIPSGSAKVRIPGRSTSRPGMLKQSPAQPTPCTTFDEIVSHPSPLPGTGSTRTDTLSFIPTLPEEKRADRKSKERKEATEGGVRKSSWGWLLGSEEKEKEKEEKQGLKKSRSKTVKPSDPTRFDVLQSSVDGGKGRESLILDRESTRLDEERKKESNRKISGDKKEKESGILSSLFGGKRRGEKEVARKANSLRGPSPEPVMKLLKPDIDYNWTRFSILEERAIYRIAHIKLANPRRPLYSQVLLSNFMYSYLAKVQQMHPQMQMIQPAAQKRQQEPQIEDSGQEDQSAELSMYERYQDG